MTKTEKSTAALPQRSVKLAKELGALQKMTVGQLAEKFLELYGQPSRSRNKPYLQKRLAWRVQELAEGGLSEKALAKIAELGDELPEKWRRRLVAPQAPAAERDPRVPRPGSVLTRKHQGRTHRVTVREDCFIHGGKEFKSLSAIARLITGTSWNGYLFFGLEQRGAAKNGGVKK